MFSDDIDWFAVRKRAVLHWSRAGEALNCDKIFTEIFFENSGLQKIHLGLLCLGLTKTLFAPGLAFHPVRRAARRFATPMRSLEVKAHNACPAFPRKQRMTCPLCCCSALKRTHALQFLLAADKMTCALVRFYKCVFA